MKKAASDEKIYHTNGLFITYVGFLHRRSWVFTHFKHQTITTDTLETTTSLEVDAQGHVWEGIALWYLVGWLDDNTTKGFNDAAADKGYMVVLTGSDGSTVQFSAAEVKRNDNIIVASLLDGHALPSQLWPLALVGGSVDQQRKINMIVSIKIVFNATETTSRTSSSP